MDVETFFAKLEKARYFEGYSDAAITQASKAIRKRLAAGLKGPHAAEFALFPGLSLVVTAVDQEMIGRDDLKQVLRKFGRASFGLFAPQAIKIRRKAGEEHYRLEFSVNGNEHVMSLQDDSWIPNAFFEALYDVTRAECGGLMFHAVEYPDPDQSGFYLWCTSRAFQAVTRAKLIPSKKFPLHPPQEDDSPAQPELAAEDSKIPALAPPADPARAERLRVYKKGMWIVLSFSKETLADWDKIATAGPSSAVGYDITAQIRHTFDLLCARHCGLTGLGDARTDAKQVVALVDRYLFGAWRAGHVEKGVTFTEATACSELMWSLALPQGCAAAAFLGDDNALCRFLSYPRGDVYQSPLGDELAFYRLLSDVALQRHDIDWAQQTSVVEGGFNDRLKKLVRCLDALRDNNEAAFQKAIAKLPKPTVPNPLRYANVVDCEVTVVAYLAQQRGWSCESFPQRIQDQILGW